MAKGLMARLRAFAEKDGRGYPDWAVRYRPVVRVLRRRGLLGPARLEVGANANGLARFAPGPVVCADLSVAHLREVRALPDTRPVAADITALPFRDSTFDTVISMDTFEHIPAASRGRAVAELMRVTRQGGAAVVAFPAGEAAFRAERRVRTAYARLTGGSIRWLDEHAAMGLPDADATRACFAEQAGACREVRLTGNAWLPAWTWMWRVLMCNWPGRGNALFQLLLRASVPLLTRLHFGRCYRAIVWIFPKAP